MSVPYQFKLLALNDLSQLMSIERQVFNPPWSAMMMNDSIQAAHTQVWGLFLADILIGFGVLSIVLNEAEILSLAIAKQHQGKGYGKIMLEFLISQAKEAKAKFIFLEVRVSHKVALALYHKLGFVEIGIRKDYYAVAGESSREDARLLSLTL